MNISLLFAESTRTKWLCLGTTSPTSRGWAVGIILGVVFDQCDGTNNDLWGLEGNVTTRQLCLVQYAVAPQQKQQGKQGIVSIGPYRTSLGGNRPHYTLCAHFFLWILLDCKSADYMCRGPRSLSTLWRGVMHESYILLRPARYSHFRCGCVDSSTMVRFSTGRMLSRRCFLILWPFWKSVWFKRSIRLSCNSLYYTPPGV